MNLDDGFRCIVPQCLINTRRPTIHGMCPPHLWDYKHEEYYEAVTGRIYTGSRQQHDGLRGSIAASIRNERQRKGRGTA